MAEMPLGEFYVRFPGTIPQLVVNEPGKPLMRVPYHTHTYGHFRLAWAGDTPGPDGRVGWHELIESAIRNDAGECIGWHEEKNRVIRGNGPDSFFWVPAEWKHTYTLLSASGFLLCGYLHRDSDGKLTTVWEGHPHVYV